MIESLTSEEITNVSVLSKTSDEMSEQLPNSRSEIPQQQAPTARVLTLSALPNNTSRVFVASPGGIFTDHLQEAVKTTHVVIQDQTTAFLNAPLTPLTPQTPVVSSPITLLPSVTTRTVNEHRKYNWDASVFDPILPVRCRNFRGELHKNRFGSGGRGRCILVGEDWYTPSEFETLCGRGNSKDWKRSIRYAGRTLQCLIDEGFLQPHATSCTCTACCDNGVVVLGGSNSAVSSPTSGPIRLFTPYKRKKRQEKSTKQELSTCLPNQTTDTLVVSIAPAEVTATQDIQLVATSANLVETAIPVISQSIDTFCPESVIMTPAATPQTPKSAPTALDFAEQRQWWQLEEMVKNVVRQAQELQNQLETTKAQCAAAREAALQQLKIQMDNEKKEALNACRVEAQMNLSRAILEAKTEKELAVEQALQQARLEMQEKLEAMVADKGEPLKRCANCDREAFSECTGCHRVSYCSTFCQRRDWQAHQDECGENVLSTDSTGIDELADDCEQAME